MTTDTHDKYATQARTELADVRQQLGNARADRDGVSDPYDQSTVTLWTDFDNIVVNDLGDGTYRLVDTDDQSNVLANYVGDE
jgi:hypothetical protein